MIKTAHLLSAAVFGLLMTNQSAAAAPNWPIELKVDATDVVHGVYHVEETIPAAPGPLTLRFVKWLPGHHAPSGRVDLLGGLHVTADGKQVVWQRDPVDIFLFHLAVPTDAHDLHLSFDFTTPLLSAQGRVSMTPAMLELEWDMAVFYPADTDAASITVRPEITLPAGWQFATALSPRTSTEKGPRFAVTDLATLIDSPVLAAPKIEKVDIGRIGGAPVRFNLAADRDAPPVLIEARLKDYRAMLEQIRSAFGDTAPFDHYELLLTVSDQLGGIGWEHLRGAEVGTGIKLYKAWQDGEQKLLLPHEFIHSWNGKYRRPEGLRSPDYGKAMDGTLLWIYEGLTQYYATVIGARSGLLSPEEARDFVADRAAALGSQAGRAWRPLDDTTAEPAINPFHGRAPYGDLRRNVNDYYDESILIWLEADARIRVLTGGRKSLDDFARVFFHADAPTLAPKCYLLDEVVADLNAVAPYDWRGFFQARVFDVAPEPPTHGLELAGWRLVRSATSAVGVDQGDGLDVMDSVGLAVGTDGTVSAVRFGSAAYAAELIPTARLLAIEGQPFTVDRLKGRIARSLTDKAPIALTVSARGVVYEAKLNWTGGLTYAHLERLPGKADLLSPIFAALPAR